ncbi:SUN domain-containing protein 3-like [Centropristis striata]|uniref:SUN domain-containing protein 3-like n=1 Tax=Centropristis striata TaxID=184440 RepID=UPI0027E073EE|nr:SUN domain-containing protein 3-like [Centropristis striata]
MSMVRRSSRLQEAGYYTEEGLPTLSFKESPRRVFRRRYRRRHHVDVPVHHESTDSDESKHSRTVQTQTNCTRTTGTQSSMSFSWLLLLAGIVLFAVHMQVQILELQYELQLKEQRMETSFPVADTMSNFALESQGASVLDHLSSDMYREHTWQGYGIWDYISQSYCGGPSEQQRRVIQGHSSLRPGECWPFSGETGHLFISLSHPVIITQVTLGHITKSQSVSGLIASAPRQFSIHGMRTEDGIGTNLGTLVYDHDGPAFQTFNLPNQEFFRYVKLEVENNWGNIDYTCLYSFRVHGKVSK